MPDHTSGDSQPSPGESSVPPLTSTGTTIDDSTSPNLSQMGDRVPTYQGQPSDTTANRCTAAAEQSTYSNGDIIGSSPPIENPVQPSDQESNPERDGSSLPPLDWEGDRLESPTPGAHSSGEQLEYANDSAEDGTRETAGGDQGGSEVSGC